jgi:hypothetical protein
MCVATDATARVRNSASVAVLNLNSGNSGGSNSASVAVLNNLNTGNKISMGDFFLVMCLINNQVFQDTTKQKSPK